MLLWDEDDDGGGGVLEFTDKLNQTQKSLGNLEEGTSLKVAGALENLSKVQDDDDDDFFKEFDIGDLDEEQPKLAPKCKPSKSICSDASASAVLEEDGGEAGLDIVSRALQGQALSVACHTIDEGNEDESMAQHKNEPAQTSSIQEKIPAQVQDPYDAVATEAETLSASAAKSPSQQHQLCTSHVGCSMDLNAFEPAIRDAIPESLARGTSHHDDSSGVALREQDNRQTEEEQQDVSRPVVVTMAPPDKSAPAPEAAQQQLPSEVYITEQQGVESNIDEAATDQDQGYNMPDNVQLPGNERVSLRSLPNGNESVAVPAVQEQVQEHTTSAPALQYTGPMEPKSPQQVPPPSSSTLSTHDIDSHNTDQASKDALQLPFLHKLCSPCQEGGQTVEQEAHGVQGPSSSGKQGSLAQGADEALRTSACVTQQATGFGSHNAGDKATAGNVASTMLEGDVCGETQAAQKEPVQPMFGESSIAKEIMLEAASEQEDNPHAIALPVEQADAQHPTAPSPDQRMPSERDPSEEQTRTNICSKSSQGGTQDASNDQAAKAPASAVQATSSPSASQSQDFIRSLAGQRPQADTGGFSRHIAKAAFNPMSIPAASLQPSDEQPVPQRMLKMLTPQQAVASQPRLLLPAEGSQTCSASQVNPDRGHVPVPKPAPPLNSGPKAQQAAAKGTHAAAQHGFLAQRPPAAAHGLPSRSPAQSTPRSITGLAQHSSPAKTSSPIITPFSGRSSMSPLAPSGIPMGSGNARPLRIAGTTAVSRQAPQQHFKKPPLAPTQGAIGAARPTFAQRPANPILITQGAAQQVFQSSARPPILIQRPTSSQQQPGPAQSPDCSHLAPIPVPQQSQQRGPTPASRAPVPGWPSQQLDPSAAPAPSARDERGSRGSIAFSDIAASSAMPLPADQAEGEGCCQPAKRQRVGGHEGNGESSGAGMETHIQEVAAEPTIQVPSRAAEAVNLTASLDKMLLEAEKLFDHVMELKVQTAIASNRLIRLDNPIVNCKMTSLHQQLLDVLKNSEQ